MHVERCLCALPRAASRTRVVLVPHAIDWDLPSNTGRAAMLALGCEVAVWGRTGRPFDPQALLRENTTHLVLHPGPSSVPLEPTPGPVRLLVPDGTWRQAARIASRLERLGARRVRVSPPPAPRLRKASAPDRVPTAFAIAAALEALGEPEPAAAVRHTAEQLVAHCRAVRGLD